MVIIRNLLCPLFSMKGETPSLGVLQQVKPSTTYMFETAVKTDGDAGIIAWWKRCG